MLNMDTKSSDIPRPTMEAVEEYLVKWQNLSDYKEQEDALYHLFCNTYLSNTNLSEVLIKCSVLNDFYSTGIFKIYQMAKHIVRLNIDNRLKNGDPELVNDISRGHGIILKTGREPHFFSFASKYCSHHNPAKFPIYDSYVEKLLMHFSKVDRFYLFKKEELRNYVVFKKVINEFRKFYQLQEFSLKQIDQYLWQFGKDIYPKKY